MNARIKLAALLPLLLLLIVATTTTTLAQAPKLLHAKSYQDDQPIDVRQYLVSEKLDGVRAYWDGKQLLSRQGHVFQAPKWFVADFP